MSTVCMMLRVAVGCPPVILERLSVQICPKDDFSEVHTLGQRKTSILAVVAPGVNLMTNSSDCQRVEGQSVIRRKGALA